MPPSGANNAPELYAANALSLHVRQVIADANAALHYSDQLGQRSLLVQTLVALGVRAVGYDLVARALPAVTRRPYSSVFTSFAILLHKVLTQAGTGANQHFNEGDAVVQIDR